MNNNIQEVYCSKEVSKLLREKGFDVKCHSHYVGSSNDIRFGIVQETGIGDINKEFYNNSDLLLSISRPTHQVAIEWLRVNFDIYITPLTGTTLKNTKYYFYEVVKDDINISKTDYLYEGILKECRQEIPGKYINNELLETKIFERGFAYKTPQEAVEAALLQTLKELI